MEKIESPKSRGCGGGRKGVEGEGEGGQRRRRRTQTLLCPGSAFPPKLGWGRGVIYLRGEEIPGTRASF